MAKIVEMDERIKFKDQTQEWELMERYKDAVNKILFSSEPQSQVLKYDDDSLVILPHLFKKVAVPGICGVE